MRIHTVPKLMAIALGLSLVGGTALAQGYDRGRDRDRDNRDNATQQDEDGNRGDRRRRGRDQQQQQQTPQQVPQTRPPEQRGPDGDRDRTDRGDRDRNWSDNDGRRDRNWGNNDRRDWRDRGDRRRNATWDRFRRNTDSPRRFRVGVYRAPPGFHYRRWHYGDRLPRAYYARHFWLSNFIVYGLFAPPPGLIWVRYGPDALLIDEYTGEIVQVRYNVFYY